MHAPTAPEGSAARVGSAPDCAPRPQGRVGTRSVPLALSLVNTGTTSGGVDRDRMETPTDMLAWMRDADLLEHPAHRAAIRSPAVTRLLHDETLRLRCAIASLFDAHASDRPYPSNALHAVSRVLSASRTGHALEPGPHGLRISGVEHATTPLALLAPVALSAAEVVTGIPSRRLGQCAATNCRTWFVDTSKGGRRRWCSMAGCGNRAKASRHRRKHIRAE